MITKSFNRCIRGLTAAGALLLGCCFLPAEGVAAQSSEDVQTQTIISLHKTRAAVADRLRQEPSVHPEGIKADDEARLFVAYLDGRIYHYCRQRYLSLGVAGLEGLPCPLNSAGSAEAAAFSPVPESAGATRAEKVSQLDQELDAALGRFDDMLLKEEEKVAAHIPRQREDGGSASGGRLEDSNAGQTGETGPERSEAAGSPSQADNVPGGEGDAPEDFVNSPADQAKRPPTSGRRDLEEGDDDIVARQLREAAEQETDPEVKERLWDEYRKYKEGIR